jgi:hypothetical protein
MKSLLKRQIMGWIAVALSIAVTCVWALWGIVETFHEGWYYDSWLLNVGMMLLQYLSPMLLFLGVTLVAIRWPRTGSCLHVLLAVGIACFFRAASNAAILLLMLPLLGIGVLYWFGRPRPRRAALALAVGLPLLVLLALGAEPALRASRRVDDGNLQARVVHGSNVDLIWAPDGPGWPRTGGDWSEAQHACICLSEDGQTLAPEPRSIWRLPTVDEAVRSMARHGLNSGGVWDVSAAVASYDRKPDKESPLWNVHSQVIYWWTATEADDAHAYIIVYDGRVWRRDKDYGPAYLGFRCVKEP